MAGDSETDPLTIAGGHLLAELDRQFHAAEAKLTGGLSPASFWLAGADWAIHAANALFHAVGLALAGIRQAGRMVEATLGAEVIAPDPKDHRFQAEAWRSQPFAALYQNFLLIEEACSRLTDGGLAVNPQNRRIIDFALRQILDLFAPSNIPWLNPEVIGATAQSGGANLLKGFAYWLEDLSRSASGGKASRFQVGRDLAITPGSVIYRNALIELIHYAPTTEAVHPEPILICPAWIMKYYILDLSPENSLVKFLVAQGFSVFILSWRNPGADQAQLTLEDYRLLGPMAALAQIGEIHPDSKVHGVGYCLGGTLMAITGAAMARDGDHRMASLTLLAAQTDFTEAGELQLFINDSQLAFLADQMAIRGTLDSAQMAGAFLMLRSNDLLWSRAVRTYLLGQRDAENDMMAWNDDGTRMPARMHEQYLRQLFLNNDLAEGRFIAGGRAVSLRDITLPCFVVGTETDHIAPWRSVYKIHLLAGGEISFTLTNGGHNAGIVSEPGHPHRYFRQTRRGPQDPYLGPAEWLQQALRQEGSWWPGWVDWLAARSGPATCEPPKAAGLAPAPGLYVLEH